MICRTWPWCSPTSAAPARKRWRSGLMTHGEFCVGTWARRHKNRPSPRAQPARGLGSPQLHFMPPTGTMTPVRNLVYSASAGQATPADMSKGDSMPDPAGQQTTIIGADTKIHGDMTFDGTARILGGFEGSITAKGELQIAESASCKATVDAAKVMIDGLVEGNV